MLYNKFRQYFWGLLHKTHSKFFVKKSFSFLNQNLLTLGLKGLGLAHWENYDVTGEAKLLDNLSSVFLDSPTIIDVGANSGEYTLLALKKIPNAKIFAFEPSPRAFPFLESLAKKNNFVAINSACGDKTGKATLYDGSDKSCTTKASFVKEYFEFLEDSQMVNYAVDVVKLDDFLSNQKISRVDLLKIDTEGFELQVLYGFENSIRNRVVDIIQFEFSDKSIFNKVFVKDFYDFLPDFVFGRLLPDGLLPLGDYSPLHCELFGFQNIIAVRKDAHAARKSLEL